MTDPHPQALKLTRYAMDKKARAMFAATQGHWCKVAEANALLAAKDARIAQLEQELEELRDDRNSWAEQASARAEDAVNFGVALQAARAQVADLSARVEAMCKDAERWQWFRIHCSFDVEMRVISWGSGFIQKLPHLLDAAIDAQMGARQGGD